MEKITFKTEDGVMISGNYFRPEKDLPSSVILLHMMPSTKESWNSFAVILQQYGFAVLAIDLRGHGESIYRNGVRMDYREFKDEQHRESMFDIISAKEFLRSKGADTTRLVIAGASIGANLALLHASIDKDVKLLVLLSAGIDYRGIKTPPLAAKYFGSVYILASKGDTRSGESSKILNDIFPGEKYLKIINGSSHGTDMFLPDPYLMGEILEWILLKSI